MGQYAQVQVRPAHAAGLDVEPQVPITLFLSLPPFSLWDDDPHVLRPVLGV